MVETAPRRQRNARGQGARLTGEIVSGALGLIDRTGSEEAVTLRAVARPAPPMADRPAGATGR
jgi:hypothetical protein